MSLVSTYVRATDGELYQNPVLADESNEWYLCFDDDDPPELVWKVSKEEDPGAPPAWLMERLGVTLLRMGVKSLRLYPGDGWKNFSHSTSAFVRLDKAIDPDTILLHDGHSKSTSGQGCFYDFDV